MTYANISPTQIRKTRLLLKMTQKEFAKVTGVHDHTVSTWETGRNSPTGSALSKIVELVIKASAIDQQYMKRANRVYKAAIANGASEKVAKAIKFALYDKLIESGVE